MCIGEIFDECFSNWLGWIIGKKDAIHPSEMMDETIMHEDDPEMIILDEAYNWLVHPKGKKERKVYHVYMAWVSIVALLKNQFHPVTMHEMRELYAEHHKTVSKAFNEIYDENINGSRYDWLDWQLFRICSVANAFQRHHPELQDKIFRTRKDLMNIRILDEKYSDEEYDDYLCSEYDYDSDFIDPNSDTEDEDNDNNIIDTIQPVNIQPIIDTLTNAIKGNRIREPTEPCDYEKDPVKAMLHDITEWLVNKEYYYDYHVYRIWYVTRMLINNNFHTFHNAIPFIYQDWRNHKTDMERCFGRDCDLYDLEDNREFCEITRIQYVLVQFQVRWSCLKNVDFDTVPLFLPPPQCQ